MQDIGLEDGKPETSCDKDEEFIADEEEAEAGDKEGTGLSLDNGTFFDSGNSSGSYMQFKRLVSCRDNFDFSVNTLHLIELLQLVHIDNGAVDTGLKFKSRNQRWFSAKKKRYFTNGFG